MDNHLNTRQVEFTVYNNIPCTLHVEEKCDPENKILYRSLWINRLGMRLEVEVQAKEDVVDFSLRIYDEDIVTLCIAADWSLDHDCIRVLFGDVDTFIKDCIERAIRSGVHHIATYHNMSPTSMDRGHKVIGDFSRRYNDCISQAKDKKFPEMEYSVEYKEEASR